MPRAEELTASLQVSANGGHARIVGEDSPCCVKPAIAYELQIIYVKFSGMGEFLVMFDSARGSGLKLKDLSWAVDCFSDQMAEIDLVTQPTNWE